MTQDIYNINIEELQKEITYIRKLSSERKNINFLITSHIGTIASRYNIPKKIIRKFFLVNTSSAEDKQQEEMWWPILEQLI